jgi:hypothetical protein
VLESSRKTGATHSCGSGEALVQASPKGNQQQTVPAQISRTRSRLSSSGGFDPKDSYPGSVVFKRIFDNIG